MGKGNGFFTCLGSFTLLIVSVFTFIAAVVFISVPAALLNGDHSKIIQTSGSLLYCVLGVGVVLMALALSSSMAIFCASSKLMKGYVYLSFLVIVAEILLLCFAAYTYVISGSDSFKTKLRAIWNDPDMQSEAQKIERALQCSGFEGCEEKAISYISSYSLIFGGIILAFGVFQVVVMCIASGLAKSMESKELGPENPHYYIRTKRERPQV